MFHGEPGDYPDSCVVWCWFQHFSLREMFGYLREKEDTYRRDVRRYAGTPAGALFRAKLEEVQAHLIWMSYNIKTSLRPPPRDRTPKPVPGYQLKLEGFAR